jgi:creatinine amidohydrolase
MRLQDLNWMDIENYLKTDDRIILVTGSTEQHAYLSLLTDALIPARMAEAVAQQTGVLVAPPLNFGVSYIFREFPGTITLSEPTYHAVLREIFESLLKQGFRRFFVLNGHGGNSLPQRIMTVGEAEPLNVIWYDWWKSAAARDFAAANGLTINHANWGENFPFNRVAESPSGVKAEIDLGAVQQNTNAREVMGDGNFGGPYQVDDTLMTGLFSAVVADVIEQVNNMKE